MSAEPKVVVGVFTDATQADLALQDLYAAGFSDEKIGLIRRDDGTTSELSEFDGDREETTKAQLVQQTEQEVTTGVITGGVVGGLVGVAAALLIPGIGPVLATGILISTLSGAALGAATGGLIGALVHLGIPEEEAHYYETEFQAGRTILIVQADGRDMEVFHIMRYHQSLTSSTDTQSVEDTDPEATIKLEKL